jgi:flagellar hook protein FlgE
VPQVLQFDNNFVGAQETTTINYEANLPSATAQLDPSNFASDPVFGAQIAGSGANLNADGPAVLTGDYTGSPAITANTTMASLGVTAGETFTVSDGTNQTTYTAQSGDTVQSLLNAINDGSAAVTASVSNGQIVLTSNGTNADTTELTMVNNAADDTADAALGFTAGGTAEPVNLVTQGLSGTFTITQTPVGGTATQYSFTIGTGSGDLQTMAQVQSYLSGLSADGITGSIDSSGNITLTAQNSDTLSVAGSGGLSATSFGIQDPTATPNSGNVTANDESTFTAESIDGGSVTAYDSKGDPVNVDLRWAKVASSTGSATWQLYYQTDTTATGTQTAWANAGATFTFGSNGQLTAINGQTSNLSSISIANLSVNGDSLGSVQVNFGTSSTSSSSGLTEFASSSTSAQITQLQQNGFAAGQLQSISVDNQNRVVGTFSNGQTIPLAEITLAQFNGVDQLQSLDGGAYAATPESGQPIYSATGTITGSALEASNVDIATQFSQLIVAQQAYSANARVMTTADQMIQSLLTVIQ